MLLSPWLTSIKASVPTELFETREWVYAVASLKAESGYSFLPSTIVFQVGTAERHLFYKYLLAPVTGC